MIEAIARPDDVPGTVRSVAGQRAIRRKSPARTPPMALFRICTIASSATLRASSASAPPSSAEAIASGVIFCPTMYSIALSTIAPAWLSSAGGGSSEAGSIGIFVSLDLFGSGFRRVFQQGVQRSVRLNFRSFFGWAFDGGFHRRLRLILLLGL